MHFNRLLIRYRQFGGLRLVREYVRLGLLWPIVRQFFTCLFTGRSYKQIYLVIVEVVTPLLLEKYSGVMEESYRHTAGCPDEATQSSSSVPTRIWFCWLQGMDQAPALVKACLHSLRTLEDEAGCEIVILTADNYSQWVSLPDYIVEKYHKGHIPHALFGDILRLELLTTYGGIWIDSTVLYTGERTVPMQDGEPTVIPSWQEILKADLFVFQYNPPGQSWTGDVSNWFIAAKQHNRMLSIVKSMIFAYWKDYDFTLHYYMFHVFFKNISLHYPELTERMPYGYSVPCLQLGKHIDDDFDEEHWQRFSHTIPWHKMNYRLPEKVKANGRNYYNHVVRINAPAFNTLNGSI